MKRRSMLFEWGSTTRSVWHDQLDPGRSIGETNPLTDDDLTEVMALQQGLENSARSRLEDVTDLVAETWDLSVMNPNAPYEAPLRKPAEIIDAMLAREPETARILEDNRGIP